MQYGLNQPIHVDLSQAPGWGFSRTYNAVYAEIVLSPPAAFARLSLSDVNFDILVPPNWVYNIVNGSGGGFVVSVSGENGVLPEPPPEPTDPDTEEPPPIGGVTITLPEGGTPIVMASGAWGHAITTTPDGGFDILIMSPSGMSEDDVVDSIEEVTLPSGWTWEIQTGADIVVRLIPPSTPPPPIGGVTIVQPPHTGGAFPPPIVDFEGEWSANSPTTMPNNERQIVVIPPTSWTPPTDVSQITEIDVAVPPGWGVEILPVGNGDFVVILRPPVISGITINAANAQPGNQGSVTITPDNPADGWSQGFDGSATGGEIIVVVSPPPHIPPDENLIDVILPPDWEYSITLSMGNVFTITLTPPPVNPGVVQINTAQDWIDFADMTQAERDQVQSVELMANISITNTVVPGEFGGVFDGNGNTITTTINSSHSTNTAFGGLFTDIGTSGVVQNVHVVVGITNTNSVGVGGIADVNRGLIENVAVTGQMTGNAMVGGIATHNFGTINGVFVGANIEANNWVGAIADQNRDNGVIRNSFSTGRIVNNASGNEGVGGIVGHSSGGIVENTFSTSEIIHNNVSSGVGGIIGNVMSGNPIIQNNVALNSNITSPGTNIGRIIGTNPSIAINYAHHGVLVNDSPISGDGQTIQNGHTVTAAEMTQAWWQSLGFNAANGWEFVNSNGIPTLRNLPASVVQNPQAPPSPPPPVNPGVVQITTVQDWINFANMTQAERDQVQRVELMADINITDTVVPGNFGGVFDGNGRTITTTITSSYSTDSHFGGLFTDIGTSGEVRNVHVVVGVNNTNDEGFGGIAGVNRGLIENVAVTGQMTSIRQVGGIATHNWGTINGVFVGANIEASHWIGGIADWNRPTGVISNSFSTGRIVNTASGDGGVGGIVGHSDGIVQNTFSTAEIPHTNVTSGVGGIIGSVVHSRENPPIIQNNVALNPSIMSSGTLIGRIIGGDVQIAMNHAHHGVLVDGSPILEDGQTIQNGQTVTTAEMTPAWWESLGFNAANGWQFVLPNIPTLANLPASVVQNPQLPSSIEGAAFDFDFELDLPQEGYDEEFYDLDLDDLLLLTPEIGVGEDGEAIVIHPELPTVDEEAEEEAEDGEVYEDTEPEKKEPEPEPDVVLVESDPDPDLDENPEDSYDDYKNDYPEPDDDDDYDYGGDEIDLELEEVGDLEDIDDIVDSLNL